MFDVDGLNVGLLLLLGVIGFTMIAHGWNHIWGGGKIAGTARWFASLGMHPGSFHAWLASITELVCGVLLIVGLATPLGAAGAARVMIAPCLGGGGPWRPGGGVWAAPGSLNKPRWRGPAVSSVWPARSPAGCRRAARRSSS